MNLKEVADWRAFLRLQKQLYKEKDVIPQDYDNASTNREMMDESTSTSWWRGFFGKGNDLICKLAADGLIMPQLIVSRLLLAIVFFYGYGEFISDDFVRLNFEEFSLRFCPLVLTRESKTNSKSNLDRTAVENLLGRFFDSLEEGRHLAEYESVVRNLYHEFINEWDYIWKNEEIFCSENNMKRDRFREIMVSVKVYVLIRYSKN